MRFILSVFLLGSLLLTGCADQLVGPTVDASGIADPVVMRAADSATLYTTWEAPESPGDYELVLRQGKLETSPDGGFTKMRMSLSGSGAYTSEGGGGDLMRGPVGRTAFDISGYVGSNRHITFDLIRNGTVVAQAEGQANEDYTELALTISFIKGGIYEIVFAPVAS